ncbi:hypothetical protein M413DRAFT_449252 [Hebeloma cylindrosporum]|uniref:RING-type domain-containing protein n=1 Tax=Hebeloma cylindrosporum TaxID=76867 RepID=A0A0C3BY59_HEBCY|nr:hypothetical protein M413DRAFT_449252 [Hebeloma cylindrosporum h7]
MSAKPNNPSPNRPLPAPSGLIGPGRSAERPSSSSTSAMDAEDMWGSYQYQGPYAGDGFGYGDDEMAGNSMHYPPDLDTTTPYTSYEGFNYPNTSGSYGPSLGFQQQPFGGFAGPSTGAGSSESSLAGALGERKKRKREEPTTDLNLYPPPAGPSYMNEGSSTGFSMGNNNWAPPYAGPAHLGANFDYREPSGSHSVPGPIDTRYFDDGLLPAPFSMHDAELQAPMGGINPALTMKANDTTESDRKGKGKAREPINQNDSSVPIESGNPPKPSIPSSSEGTTTSSKAATTKATKPPADPLSDYTCPICFSAPTNATITPCGHICCGSCLFAAIKAGIQRAGMEHHPGGNRGRAAPQARCPVCRSIIPGWDGKGGGVIGLKVRAIFSF